MLFTPLKGTTFSVSTEIALRGKEGCLLDAGKNNGIEFFESHSVPSTNEELVDQK
jgi:hypothetical protein